MGFTPSIFDNLAHFPMTRPMMLCDTGTWGKTGESIRRELVSPDIS